MGPLMLNSIGQFLFGGCAGLRLWASFYIRAGRLRAVFWARKVNISRNPTELWYYLVGTQTLMFGSLKPKP